MDILTEVKWLINRGRYDDARSEIVTATLSCHLHKRRISNEIKTAANYYEQYAPPFPAWAKWRITYGV